MGFQWSDSLGSTPGGTSAETVIATVPAGNTPPGVSTGPGDVGVVIRGYINVTLGTGATGIEIRAREGALGTTALAVAMPITGLTAGSTYTLPFSFIDRSNYSGQASPVQYVLTVQQTGAPTTAATVNFGLIHTEV